MYLVEGIAIGAACGWQFAGAPLMAFRLGASGKPGHLKLVGLLSLIALSALLTTLIVVASFRSREMPLNDDPALVMMIASIVNAVWLLIPLLLGIPLSEGGRPRRESRRTHKHAE